VQGLPARTGQDSHATHALERGADFTTVRDNLRHASIATTSTYMHSDDTKRARKMAEAFAPAAARPYGFSKHCRSTVVLACAKAYVDQLFRCGSSRARVKF
jgi:hypothetical protein